MFFRSSIVAYRPFFIILSFFICVSCTKRKEIEVINEKLLYGLEKTINDGIDVSISKKREILTALQLANTPTNRLQLNNLLESLITSKDSISFKEIATRLKEYANNANDSEQLARLYHYSGAYNEANNKDNQAYSNYVKAAKLYQNLGDVYKVCEIRLYQARILYKKGFTILAVSRMSEVITLLEADNKDSFLYLEAQRRLGTYLVKWGKWEEGIVNYNKTLEVYLKHRGTLEDKDAAFLDIELAELYIDIAEAYFEMHRFDVALIYLNKVQKNILTDSNYATNFRHKLFKNLITYKQTNDQSYFIDLKNLFDDANEKGYYIQAFEAALRIGDLYIIKGKEKEAADWYLYLYDLSKKNDVKFIQHALVNNLFNLQEVLDSICFTKFAAITKEVETEKKKAFYELFDISRNTKVVLLENRELKNRQGLVYTAGFICIISLLLAMNYLRIRNKVNRLELVTTQKEADENISQLIIERGAIATESKTTERRKIACDLHDYVVNGIFTVRFNLELLETPNYEVKESLVKELNSLEQYLRTISHDLSTTTVIGQGDLVDFTEKYVLFQVNEWNTNFVFQYDKSFDFSRIRENETLNLFYIIREAIQNVNKHSIAKNCLVRFNRINNNKLRISIIDDGIGLNDDFKHGIGLKSMKSRAEILQAKFTIKNLSPKGTSIRIDYEVF